MDGIEGMAGKCLDAAGPETALIQLRDWLLRSTGDLSFLLSAMICCNIRKENKQDKSLTSFVAMSC